MGDIYQITDETDDVFTTDVRGRSRLTCPHSLITASIWSGLQRVEVSDRRDRHDKVRLYARSGVRSYWVIDRATTH